MEKADVVVAGGGIIGLSCALELGLAGYRVVVLERGRAMSEASWAAAGMLAAEDPDNPPELSELALLSRSLYPAYLDSIERLSGRSIPLRTTATLQASIPGMDPHWSLARGAISAEEAIHRVPGLVPGGRSFLWLAEASVDPRDLCQALPEAAIAAGVQIRENEEALAVSSRPGGVEISSAHGSWSAEAFINCCGAWADSAAFSAPFQPGRRTRVEPCKGHMLAVEWRGEPTLRHVLRTPEIYLVPRGGGRIVVGATVERAGFDRQIRPEAIHHLLSLARELWPPIAGGDVVDVWTGFRPATGDALPVIGPAAQPRCWLAGGHFRNGILLAPATAQVIRNLIAGAPAGADLGAFRPEALQPSMG